MALQDIVLTADSFFQASAGWLNTIVIVLVMLLSGFIIGKIVDRILRRLLADVSLDERFARLFKAKRNYARAIRHTIVRLIYLATVVLALEYLSLLRSVFIVLLGAIVLVVIISFLIAGLDLFPNLSGAFALRHKRIGIGDEITVIDKAGVITGVVIDMTLLDMRIRRHNGDVFFVPNAAVVNDRIVKRRQHAPHA